MMRLAIVMLTGAALSGCGAPANTPQGFCEAQANSNPAVKENVEHSVSNPYFLSQSSEQIRATKARAVQDCLRRQGVLPSGGGVEGLPQSDTLFQK